MEIDDPLEPGMVLFNRYLLERRLGGGGTGTVWLVRHRELDSERALKLIVSGIAGEQEGWARFRREAGILDRLNHPNAARVYDVGIDGGLGFIEMEYVRGKSLNQLLEPGMPMPLDWVADLLDQLCEVLQAANDQGITHGDLKPSNLMLVEGSQPLHGKKVLKLLDFGITKLCRGADDIHNPAGAFIGTPLYSSPEQIVGDMVDSRSDLYAVGLILYELLTGHRPFSGSISAIFYKQTMVPPPPFAEVNPNVVVSPDVEHIVMKCLAKDPGKRPRSPRELAAMFHRVSALAYSEDPGEGLESLREQAAKFDRAIASIHAAKSTPHRAEGAPGPKPVGRLMGALQWFVAGLPHLAGKLGLTRRPREPMGPGQVPPR